MKLGVLQPKSDLAPKLGVPVISQSTGKAMPEDTRQYFETRFGHDFGNVRVHADEAAERSASSFGARAYTVSHDIVFNRGRYSPNSPDGRRLLAHELTHVVQQSRGGSTPSTSNTDSLERDARRAADNAIQPNQPVNVAASSGVGMAFERETLQERAERDKAEQFYLRSGLILPPGMGRPLPLKPDDPTPGGGNVDQNQCVVTELGPPCFSSMPVFNERGELIRPTPAIHAPTNADVRSWPSVLAVATRDAKNRVTKVMNKTELNNTALGGPATQTPEQKSIIEQIKAKRAKVPDNPAMTARSSYHRGDADTKGGYQNAGKTVTKLENPYSDPKSRQVWDAINQEISNEGGISAVNTYDDAWVTLGSGFAGVLLSRVMEEFLSKDEAARNMFLDVGVTFADGKLRIVNTDNGAIEEDKLTGGGGARNAQMIFALSKPVLNLFTSIAETEGHAKIMQGAERDQTLGLKFTPKVAENWSDMMAVRLVAHLIHFRPDPNWPRYESCNGNVKQILGVVAPVIKNAYRDPKMGNAYVIDSGQTAVLFAMAHGKAKEALDSPAPMAIPADTPAGSLQNVLLMQSPGDATKYFKVTLP